MMMVDSANAGGAKAIEGVGDQRPPGDRHHRLARAIAVGPQAGAVARGDDPAVRGFSTRRSLQDIQEIGQRGHGGENRTGCAAAERRRPGRLRARSRRSPCRGAARLRGRGAGNRRRRGSSPASRASGSRAARKIAGSGFSAPTRWLSVMTPNSGARPALSADRFEIAVEIRDDAEPIALAEPLRGRADCGRRWRTCPTGNAPRRAGRVAVGRPSPFRPGAPARSRDWRPAASTVAARSASARSVPTSGSSAA